MGTRDWMRGGETERPIREAWPLRGVIAWTLGLVVVANIAFAVIRLVG
jgi:cytochrome c oxidase assembly factor CtaG